MNKTIITGLSILLLLALGACSAQTAAPAAGAEQPELPLTTQMLVGTLQLEGGELAVDAAQAKSLLPLWKGVRALNNASDSSQVEIDALARQIQGSLSAAQLQAITEQHINFQSVRQVMSSLGIQGGPGGAGAAPAGSVSGRSSTRTSSSSSSGSRSSSGGGGGFGGPPDMGGMMPPGGMMGGTGASSGSSGESAVQRSSGAGGQFNAALVDALIKILEERAAGA